MAQDDVRMPPYAAGDGHRRLVDDLKSLVGEDHVSADEPARRWAARDALSRYRAFGRLERLARPALAVVRPGDAREVASVLKWAAERGVAVVPRGAGTGVMGALIPLRPAVVIDLSRLNHVQVDPDGLLATAGAGATLVAVAEAAARAGLLFAHDPWSLPVATVGGAIATNGMGYLYGRYGTMADQVLALEVALSDGSLWRSRFSPAGVAGPALTSLLAGSQGTMGVITEAVLRLWPAPEVQAFRAYRFRTFEAGFRAVLGIWRAGVVPAVLDLSDSGPESPPSGPLAGPQSREPSTLILGFFGLAEEVEAQTRRAERVAREHEAQDLGPEPATSYWLRRHETGDRYRRLIWEPHDLEALDQEAGRFEYLNMALPAGRVLEYRRGALELAEAAAGVIAGETGLWGRPEIFSILLFESPASPPAAGGRHPVDALVDRLLSLCHEMGGTMEAIHGPGLRLRHLLADEWGPGLGLLQRIKRAWDPAGILNPGKWGED